MDNEQTSKEPEARTWRWVDRISNIIRDVYLDVVCLFMIWIVWIVLGGSVPPMLRAAMDMTLWGSTSLGVAVLLLTLLHVFRAVWGDRRKIVSAVYPKNISAETFFKGVAALVIIISCYFIIKFSFFPIDQRPPDMSPDAYSYCKFRVFSFNEQHNHLNLYLSYLRGKFCENVDTEEYRTARRLFRISPEIALLNEMMPLAAQFACDIFHKDIECTIYRGAARETSEQVADILTNKSVRPSGFFFYTPDPAFARMVGIFKTRQACVAAETAFRNLDFATKRCRALEE